MISDELESAHTALQESIAKFSGILWKKFFFFSCTVQYAGSHFSDQGSNPCPLHWKFKFLTTEHQGRALWVSGHHIDRLKLATIRILIAQKFANAVNEVRVLNTVSARVWLLYPTKPVLAPTIYCKCRKCSAWSWTLQFGLLLYIKNVFLGTSLVVQWLRLHAPNAGGPGSIVDQGIRSHMLQIQIQHSQINKHF